MYEYKICKEIGFEDLTNNGYITKMMEVARKAKLHAFCCFIGFCCWGDTSHHLLRIEFSSKEEFGNWNTLLELINEAFKPYAKVSYHINFGEQCIAGHLDYVVRE